MEEPSIDQGRSFHAESDDKKGRLGYVVRMASIGQHGLAATCQRQLGEDEVHHGLANTRAFVNLRNKLWDVLPDQQQCIIQVIFFHLERQLNVSHVIQRVEHLETQPVQL